MPKLPKLSIAAKLYTIFTLLATATFALAGIAVVNCPAPGRDDRGLRDVAFPARSNVERVNGLIYAVVMESRGIYMSSDHSGREAVSAAHRSAHPRRRSPRTARDAEAATREVARMRQTRRSSS